MPQQAKKIGVLIIDDHAMFRAGLRMAIEHHPGLAIVGEASNRAEALQAIAAQPDIVLLDLDLDDDNGLDLLPELLAAAPATRVILLTGLRDPEIHRRAILGGAMGLVLKKHAIETMIKAIEKVHAGEVWLDRAMIASILNDRGRPSLPQELPSGATQIAKLTPREREIVGLIGEGLKNKQIADRLFISEATVRHHLTAIFAKFGVADRFELVMYAYRHGLAKPPR